MDRETRRIVESYRRDEAGPIENNLIDELVGGELDRDEFLQRATMFGLGAGRSARSSLRRRGGRSPTAHRARRSSGRHAPRRHPGLRRLARAIPAQRGRVARVRRHPRRVPDLHDPDRARSRRGSRRAGSRTPNATVWTFQIRRGVKFHNGKTLTARDVVASMKQYVSKGSNAGLSPYFDAAGVSARGSYTVVFRLKQPIGVFPYLLSQTTYQATIQLAAIAAKPGTWVASGMIGTGPFRLETYVDKRSAELVRQPDYWGGRPPLDGVRITFYQGSAPLVLALRAGQIDLAMQLSPQEAQPFKNNSKYTYYRSRPRPTGRSACGPTSPPSGMRGSVARWRSPINRPQQVAESCSARRRSATTARSGRDSPRPTGRPSSARRTSQLARALLQAAGAENLKFNLTTWNFLDHTDHAASIQAYARQAGIEVGLEVMDVGEVLRLGARRGGLRHHDAVAEPALDADGVRRPRRAEHLPHAVLHVDRATGTRRTTRTRVRPLARTYLGAAEVAAQRTATKRMAGILLRDTPVITDYFINYVTASSSKVKNYVPEGISHIRLAKVSLA